MKPIFHWRNRKDWSLTIGKFALGFERRYYRPCGLFLWLGDHPVKLWPYTPTEAENRALDERNARGIARRQAAPPSSGGK
jgi:hypothetical protein